jgi:uncharacterized protein (UPF0335 family)
MKKTKALARQDAGPITPTDAVRAALATVADAFSGGEIVPEKLAQGWVIIKQIEDAVENTVKVAKKQVETFVLKHGTRVTDAGTMRTEVGGIQLEVRPTRTGFDPKKVEALMRAKELDLNRYMDAEVVYKLNAGKLADAVSKGKLTAAELETCRYEPSYAVQKPKPVGEE